MATEYPHFPFLQVPLAKLENQPIWQVPLAELKNENREFVQVPLAQITWYHHISLLSKVKDEAERDTNHWLAYYRTSMLTYIGYRLLVIGSLRELDNREKSQKR